MQKGQNENRSPWADIKKDKGQQKCFVDISRNADKALNAKRNKDD